MNDSRDVLISKEGLIRRLREAGAEAAKNGQGKVASGVSVVIPMVRAMEPADAAPANEGTWIHMTNGFLHWLECDQCGRRTRPEIWNELKAPLYCDVCGSYML